MNYEEMLPQSKILILFVMSWVHLSCAHVSHSFQVISHEPIADITSIPQSAEILLSNVTTGETSDTLVIQKSFKENFYSPWHPSKSPLTVEFIQSEFSKLKECYGENLLKRPEDWLVSQSENANWRNFKSVNQYGIILRTTHLRVLPTHLPCFGDPSLAGEGFPFDYVQETQLYLGTPVWISHFSQDGRWAFVESSVLQYGWVTSTDLGFVSQKDREYLENLPLGTLKVDQIPLMDVKGQWIDNSRIGSSLPVKSQSDSWVSLYVPWAQSDRKVIFRELKINSSFVLTEPLRWVKSDIQQAMNPLIGKPYGWGNLLGNRDCSGMIRDFYALFHVMLPPSSSRILNYGEVIDLSFKSPEDKLKILEKKGIPFRTILYRKGHVGIYIGSWLGPRAGSSASPLNRQLLMFHAVWGVKTKNANQEGRNLIGKAVITTLEYGKELPDFDSSHGNFLSELSKMVILN